MILELPVLLILIFFFISIIYASAGLGGGSSYLAVLSLFSLAYLDIRMIALICNIVVVSGSSYIFYRGSYMKLKNTLGLLMLSMPMAFLGGQYPIEESSFYILLGMTLLGSSILMISSFKILPQIRISFIGNSVIGGFIGFLSGVVGIGGGIFLAPVLHLGKWDNGKTIAATCAFFILINSIAGLSGQIYSNGFNLELKLLLPLLLAVLFGGLIGSKLSINFLSSEKIKLITALLVFIVGLRLLIKYL